MHLVIILVAAVFIMICLAVLGSQTLPALLHRVLFLNAGFTGSGKPSSITIAKILGIYTSEKGKKGRDAAIGFVLTVKSSARYDKIAKEPLSSEYYLLGTLLSVALAVIIGSGVSGGKLAGEPGRNIRRHAARIQFASCGGEQIESDMGCECVVCRSGYTKKLPLRRMEVWRCKSEIRQPMVPTGQSFGLGPPGYRRA